LSERGSSDEKLLPSDSAECRGGTLNEFHHTFYVCLLSVSVPTGGSHGDNGT